MEEFKREPSQEYYDNAGVIIVNVVCIGVSAAFLLGFLNTHPHHERIRISLAVISTILSIAGLLSIKKRWPLQNFSLHLFFNFQCIILFASLLALAVAIAALSDS
jgi:hypothetical protein